MSSHEWEAQEPLADFPDRVMERIAREKGRGAPARPRLLFRACVAGALAIAATAALVAIGPMGWTSERGEASPTKREEVHIGRRGIAVMEPGARVAWDGDVVTQTKGDVFYRVEHRMFGQPFVVHTPEGDIRVLGTCFRVRFENVEDPLIKRNMKVGALGAAVGAAVIVSVYEGTVTLSRAAAGLTLTAGDSARANAEGVARAPSFSGEAKADPLLAANANLADSVGEYQRRLTAIEAQKAAVERQLKEARERLAAAAKDGQVAPYHSEYDLSQDDWKDLAKKGEVLARFPCPDSDSWDTSTEVLNAMGLAPQDATTIHDAMQQSAERIWSTVRPLCVRALDGNVNIADKLGASLCQQIVLTASDDLGEDSNEATRRVAQIRAGLAPMPSDPDGLGPYGQLIYTMSGEGKALEQQLSQSFGPETAHRMVFGPEGESVSSCALHFTGGPRR